MELNKLYNQNCLPGLKEIEEDSIDLIITSPVYKDSDGYNPDFLMDVLQECYRVSKTNSLFFLNFGHLAEDKARPFKVLEMAMKAGYRLNDTITWVKNHYRPIQGNKRLNNLSEFIFLLHKASMPDIDRLAVGVPYKDKSNVKRFAGGRDLKCRGNVWEIPYETINDKEDKLHNDRFPITLPELCIKLSGIKDGAIVLDPFAGSATTLLAAKNLNKSYIGFEIHEANWETAQKRLNK